MKKILTTTLTLAALTIGANAATVFDFQFNDGADTALDDATDSAGSNVWNGMVRGLP